MYLNARAWGIQPGEFWAMTLSEFEVEFDWRQKQAAPQGRLTEEDRAELAALLQEDAPPDVNAQN